MRPGTQFTRECSPCSRASVSPRACIACRYCPIGKQPAVGQTACVRCQDNMASTTPHAVCSYCPDSQANALGTACEPCGLSQVFHNLSKRCICAAGKYRTGTSHGCAACGPLHFKRTAGDQPCDACAVGTESTHDSTGCTCPQDHYNTSFGQIVCAEENIPG